MDAPPVSPTGEAILPAKYVPMAMGLASLPAGIGGLLAAAAATGLVVPPHLAAWLGVASGVLWLALGVISPGLRRPPTAVVAIAAASLLLWSSPARAQQLAIGPSVPLMLVRPGDVHPVSVAPGAGISAGVDLFPSTVFGSSVHLLSVGGDTFGSIQAASQLAGAGSIALHVTLAETLTLLFGLDLYRSDSTGLFAGTFTSKNLFFGLGLDYGFIDRLFLGHQAAVVVATPEPAAPVVHPNAPPKP